MTKKVTELNNDNFDSFLNGDNVIVDFWAPWCGPCRMMAPFFEEASEELKDRVKFAKVNVDDNQELAERFQVMSIPTMIFFKDKEQVNRTSGVLETEEIVNLSKESFF
jgi:thioredoxin 1